VRAAQRIPNRKRQESNRQHSRLREHIEWNEDCDQHGDFAQRFANQYHYGSERGIRRTHCEIGFAEAVPATAAFETRDSRETRRNSRHSLPADAPRRSLFLRCRVVSWDQREVPMRLLTLSAALLLLVALAACDRTTSAPTTPTTPISAFTGTWRSTSTSTGAGACTAINWSVTPATLTSATITYTATCAGVPVSGTANGTLNGATLNWTTTGTAANACPYALSGTAVPDSTTDLRVAYSGTVCSVPVSGSDVLRR
jgi:hypothetical protein